MKSKVTLIIVLVLLILSIVGTIFVTTLFLKSERTVQELNAKIDELSQTTTLPTEDTDKVKVPDTNFIVDENGGSKAPEGQVGYRKITEDGDLIFEQDSYANYTYSDHEVSLNACIERDGFVYVNFKNSIVDINRGKITGFSGKPVSVYVAFFGQGVGDNSYNLLVLMDDGSVEYVKASDLTAGKYTSAGKIGTFNNVVRIEDGNIAHKNAGGYHGAALVTDDGSRYVLSPII